MGDRRWEMGDGRWEWEWEWEWGGGLGALVDGYAEAVDVFE